MPVTSEHTFHIPVMGLGFTIDTPIKVAHFGISSVLSIIEDHLVEQMREVICRDRQLEFVPIVVGEPDSRSRRITAYLNLLKQVVDQNFERLSALPFEAENDLAKYFELLPDTSANKALYKKLPGMSASERTETEQFLRSQLVPGSIDVNIMTKVDKINYDAQGEKLPVEYSDALSALRGFANSSLTSSVVFSAGLNPRLYSYCETFDDFFPNREGELRKKIILKVSDYRSALIQGKFLAKKGLWVSEFRIESGLNCGGHAFATEGLLMGPILEEFKLRRDELFEELFKIWSETLALKGKQFTVAPGLKITAQGGIGTAAENNFLLGHYKLDATGWGSPFLLVPEATSVDDDTLRKLATAKQSDYYLSHASPLGVPFNNFKLSSSEEQRKRRIEKHHPGSPCYKKFLSTDTEFTEHPICTASREYQNLKIKQTEKLEIPKKEKDAIINKIMEKDCLCEGLGAGSLIKNHTRLSHGLEAVAICPGPNLAYFSGTFSLREMIDHIYGRKTILNSVNRPHVFVNELKLYVDYLKTEVENSIKSATQKQVNYFNSFRTNLLNGIDYYHSILPSLTVLNDFADQMSEQLSDLKGRLQLIQINVTQENLVQS
ncbi:MAG: hypothetical protein PSX36_06230 [bacterium]|nr:hypothetical protein [bacterium]